MSETKGKRPRRPIRTTPRLVLKWPKLLVADEYKGKRLYKTDGIIDRDAAAPILAAMEEVMIEAKAEAEAAVKEAKAKALKGGKKFEGKEPTAGRLYSVEVDETGEETGRIIFRFKTAAEYKKIDPATGEEKIVRKTLPFFSASGKPIPTNARPDLWGGSVVRLSYTADPYFVASTGEYGVSLRLEAVKVIEAKTGKSRDAAAYGFDDEEDGYEASDDAAAATVDDGGAADEEEPVGGSTPDF
jgi:hypothetical protein